MSIFYIDLDNGSDAADGLTWANAWKTITNGATAARIAPGDTIRISKTPDPVSIGNATWTDCPSGGFAPTTVNISSSTNASPIEITTSANHGLVTGDVVLVSTHIINYTANGNWQITYISATKFTLDGSVGVATGSGTGTIRKVNSKAVVLATAQNVNVVTTEGGWTGAGDTTLSMSTGGNFMKSGYAYPKLDIDSSPQTSTLQAYRAITSTDFSSYQKLSFWIYNSAAIVENNWYVALCSDTAGATPVDVFKIPAIPSTSRSVPLTITKDGGGNLGSAIQSVAIYTDTVAPTASMSIRIDNFIACTTNGLCLQSLISKNGSAQGGTEGYYGIQSINGKVVVLDNDTNTVSTAGRGYSGTSETVETFIRSTFKTAMAASSSTQVSVLNDSGTLGNLIAYEFGYEIGTTNQNGETFLDGLNGHGYGIYFSGKNYNSINNVSTHRYNYGIYLISSNINSFLTLGNVNNCTTNGILINNSYGNSLSTIVNCNNNAGGISLSGSGNTSFSTITNLNNNMGVGLYLANSSGTSVSVISNSMNNANYPIYFTGSSGVKINTLSTSKNSNGGIYNDTGINYIRNASIGESTEVGTVAYTKGVVWSYDHDQTDGNHWGFTRGGTFNWQTSIKHDTEVGSWKTAINSNERDSNNKIILKIAEVAGTQSTNLIVKAWVMKDHATNIGSRLVCYEDTALNITEQADTKADDTDWEQLSITLNSAHANPVFEIFLETWYVAGTSNSYCGTITVT